MRNQILALALVVCASPSFAGAAQETEHVNKTVKLERGGTLRLKSFSGRVTITASDRSDVVIDAMRRGDREWLDRQRLDIRAEGSTVVVVENQTERSWWNWSRTNRVVETDFDIKVPRQTNLDVSVFSASVTVQGVEGSKKVHSFSSRLQVDDGSGPIDAHTFSGAIVIRARTWQPNQSIDVDTFSGNVELHVPDSARGTVTFNSFSGHLNSEVPLTLHSSSRRSLKAELGSGAGGTLRFKTFSGNVKIDR